MRSFIMELARTGGAIARKHFRSSQVSVDRKGRSDYVSHVDRQVEEAITTRIRAHYPQHAIIGEEGVVGRNGPLPDLAGPCWIIDPIDGTTNFIRGHAAFAVSIAFCDVVGQPKVGVIYDPMADELFIAERGAGLWLNHERVYTSGCTELSDALVATALPFRHLDALADGVQTLGRVQTQIDDIRRSGSCALDLAHVAVGRLDAYFELGIWSWDTAAGELLVRCGGGTVTDFAGVEGDLLRRRSLVAAASDALHSALMAELGLLLPWAQRPPYDDHAQALYERRRAADI